MNFEVLIALRHSIFWAPDARFDIHYFVYLNDSGGAPRWVTAPPQPISKATPLLFVLLLLLVLVVNC